MADERARTSRRDSRFRSSSSSRTISSGRASTVFFRLLLAIPHLVVVALWGIAALAVRSSSGSRSSSRGKAPQSLQAFVVSYLRYSVQVSAYLYLAADAVSARSGAARAIRSTSRSSRRGGSRAAGLPLASCSRFPVLLLAAVVGGGRGSSDLVGRSLVGHATTRPGRVGCVGRRRSRQRRPSSRGSRRSPAGRTPRGLRDLVAYAHRLHGPGAATCCSSRTGIRRAIPTRDAAADAELPPHPGRLELDRPTRAVAR